MKKIIDDSQLLVGRWYWCQSKQWPESVSVKQVFQDRTGPKYMGDRMWGDQAMASWNIVGPIERPTDSKFLLTVSKANT